MNTIRDWAARWPMIPMAAIVDLETRFGLHSPHAPAPTGRDAESESAVQANVRLEAARKNVYLFRNNVGAGYMDDGSFLRFGLANDSKQLNERLKSGDLIGIRKVAIQQWHVGGYIGQFVSREIKPSGWQYTGTGREPAQLAWAQLIASQGGDACFATSEGTL